MDVVAKLSFRSADRVTEQAIDYGVWLDSPINCTDMEVGDTRELLICIAGDNLLALDDPRDINHGYHEEGAWIDIRNTNGLEFVEIRLVDRRTATTQTFNFRIWRAGIRFNVAQLG